MKGNLIWENVIKVVTLENSLDDTKNFVKSTKILKLFPLSAPIKAVPKYA